MRDRARLVEVLSRPDRPVASCSPARRTRATGTVRRSSSAWPPPTAATSSSGKVFFLEDYDIELARVLVQGVDVWLNTPMRPLEAWGTSGMKARRTAASTSRCPTAGGPRPRTAQNGWSITGGALSEDPVAIDNLDAADILRLIDLEIAPLFFDRRDDGVPARWLERSVRSMRMVAERFSARRMVEEYRDWAYVPSAKSWFVLRERDFAAARDAVGRKRRLRRGWKQIQVLGVELPENGTLELGERLEAVVDLDLGDLQPEDVRVELVVGRPSRDGQLDEASVVALAAENGAAAVQRSRPRSAASAPRRGSSTPVDGRAACGCARARATSRAQGWRIWCCGSRPASRRQPQHARGVPLVSGA